MQQSITAHPLSLVAAHCLTAQTSDAPLPVAELS